jgi:valyl-tRNA synthetase
VQLATQLVTLTEMEGEKTAKQLAKEEAKRLKLEKFKEKQAKLAQMKKSTKEKESAVERLTKLTDQLVLEEVPVGHKKDVTTELASTYVPRQVEHSWYSFWEKGGFFKPENQPADAKAKFVERFGNNEPDKFVMVIPPPNVTGTLHIGHALTCAIQDCLVRWNRMRGKTTLWVPGSDHAGIATQVVVEKKIQREMNKSRHDLGREAFIKEVWKWKNEKGDFIYDQLRKMGCSLDWDRAVFTLDDVMVRAVTEAFVRLESQGYITRNKRLVNWSCSLKSAISDIEVDYEELTERKTLQVPGYDKRIEFGIIETFAYEVYNEDKSAIADKIWVSTTRLETMLGDTAVAVHPTDERYKHLHGRFVKHPFCDRQFPIICDEKVEKDFGTGAVKITPAHDHEDYDKGMRHNLEFIDIFTDDGLITDGYGMFSGMKRFDARFAIRAELKKLGLLVEEKPKNNPMKVPICSRSKDIIEPRVKEQWFMDCEKLVRQALELTVQGKLKIPDAQMNIWKRWMDPESIKRHPWCISRQLWWGHRIPAYKARIKGQGSYKWVVARNIDEARRIAAQELSKQQGDITDQDQIELEQDEDVLDTWFSSGLFPFAVFGWPDETEDLKKFYPTQLLETGEDIIFFWVARMVILGLALTGKLPFGEVCLHPIVRDAEGRKMSKSLGNVIDPLDVISGIRLDQLHDKLKDSNLDVKEFERATQGQKKLFPQGIPECGTDALRFRLCEYVTPGSGDIHLMIGQLVGDRLLCNKIWQACKFVFITLGDDVKFKSRPCDASARTAHDNSIIGSLLDAVREVDKGFRTFTLRTATIACRKFWKDDFCSKYIESVKDLRKESELPTATKETLFFCLEVGLRLLHPLMPFITEELYQRLMTKYSLETFAPSICVARYPEYEDLKDLFQIQDAI